MMFLRLAAPIALDSIPLLVSPHKATSLVPSSAHVCIRLAWLVHRAIVV
jgi:hypothetical protein